MKPVITRIDPIPRQRRKIRTAAYCRVSSDREAQLISLSNQRTHYEAVIAARPDWAFAGIYCDEGLSGTSKDGRPELIRLIGDCMAGRIDLVITKSISRFARNTMDCLELVRLLTAHGVNIFFEKENLGTHDAGGELILSILASIAEEESRSISENEKWAIRRRFQRGTFRLSRAPYGYDLANGEIIVNPQEAAVVRYIFRSILNGRGTSQIAADLNAQNIPTKRQGSWHAGTIQSMVHNCFFAGDMLMQKTWRDSSYRVQFNYGEFDQYYIEDHHPAIVPREVFTAANLTCAQRGREKNNVPNADKYLRNDPHHNRYCFTGRLICGKCGDTLKRQMIYRSDGSHAIWVCRTHLADPEACSLKRILEADIMNAFVTMMNKLAFSRKYLLQPYIEGLAGGSTHANAAHDEDMPPNAGSANDNNLPKYGPDLNDTFAGYVPDGANCQIDFLHGATFAEQTTKASAGTNEQILKAETSLDARKLLIMYYSKGRIEPAVFHQKMAMLKRGILAKQYSTGDLAGSSLLAGARELNTFLAGWKIGETAFSEDAFTRFVDSIRIDSRSQVTFCLKCGLELSEKIGGLRTC